MESVALGVSGISSDCEMTVTDSIAGGSLVASVSIGSWHPEFVGTVGNSVGGIASVVSCSGTTGAVLAESGLGSAWSVDRAASFSTVCDSGTTSWQSSSTCGSVGIGWVLGNDQDVASRTNCDQQWFYR